jgi:hypothetical protein
MSNVTNCQLVNLYSRPINSMILQKCVVSSLVSLVFTSFAPCVAETVVWQFQGGDELRYEVMHDTSIKVDAGPAGKFDSQTDQTVRLGWKVSDSRDQQATINQRVESLELKVAMPGGMELAYDSATGKPAEGIAAMIAPMFDVLTKTPVTLQVTPAGELTDLATDEEALEKLKTLPAIKALGELAAEEGLRQLSEAVLLPLPQDDLAPGVAATRKVDVENRILGKLTGTITWKYTGKVSQDGKEYERFEPTMELAVEVLPPTADGTRPAGPKPLADPQLESLTTTGEALFDAEQGRLHSSTLKVDFTIQGTLSGNATSCHVEQTTRVTAR